MSLVYEATTGMWVFGGIFMLNEPGTSETLQFPLGLWRVGGCFTILFQQFGRVEQTFAFALLLTNVSALRWTGTANGFCAG